MAPTPRTRCEPHSEGGRQRTSANSDHPVRPRCSAFPEIEPGPHGSHHHLVGTNGGHAQKGRRTTPTYRSLVGTGCLPPSLSEQQRHWRTFPTVAYSVQAATAAGSRQILLGITVTAGMGISAGRPAWPGPDEGSEDLGFECLLNLGDGVVVGRAKVVVPAQEEPITPPWSWGGRPPSRRSFRRWC